MTTTTAPTTDASRTARGALWLAANGVVVKASQTVVLLALAAALVPSALGLVAVGSLVANIANAVNNLGTAGSLVYWRDDVRRAARTAVTLGVGMGSLLAVALWVSAPWLARTLHAEDGGVAVIRGLTVVLPCLAVGTVTNELLRRQLSFFRRIIPDTTSSVVGAVVAIALVSRGHGVMALVVGQITQAVLAMVLSWVVHPPVLPGWNLADARGLLAYGGPFAGANLLELVQLNVDYVIVARFLDGDALGQYSLAFRLTFMPYLMIVVVSAGAAFPYLCRMRGADLGHASETVLSGTLSVVLPLCALLALMADQLRLLGDKWSPAVPLVLWLAVYALCLSVGHVVQNALNAGGRPGWSMVLRLTHVGVLTVVLLLVVHRGVLAVAHAQAAIGAVMLVVALVMARVLVEGFSPWRFVRTLLPALVATAVMAGAVVVVRLVAGPSGPSLAGLLLVALGAVALYAGAAWLLARDQVLGAVRLVRGSA